MYRTFHMIVIEKVARILKVSPNSSVYIVFTIGLIGAWISKVIEGHQDSLENAHILVLMVYGVAVFVTILNILFKDEDWFAKRDAKYVKAEKDAERALMAQAIYKKWHPDE